MNAGNCLLGVLVDKCSTAFVCSSMRFNFQNDASSFALLVIQLRDTFRNDRVVLFNHINLLVAGIPGAGYQGNVARPPPSLIMRTACAQVSRRLSPLTPLAPMLLSPHTVMNGTFTNGDAMSAAVTVSQPPSTLTSARTSCGRLRTTSRP